LQGSEVTDFSGKVHFSSALKQVEARTALFTKTAQGKWENIKPADTLGEEKGTAPLFGHAYKIFISRIHEHLLKTLRKHSRLCEIYSEKLLQTA